MKKSITPVIAIVILLLITVGIATITYFWISSLQMRTQASPASAVSSITKQKSDRLKLISVSNESITIQDTSGENVSDASVLVNGINRTINFTQDGQFIIINWDAENVTVTGDYTDVDVIVDNSILTYGVGATEAANVFTGFCGNDYCKSGKESPNTCPNDCDAIDIAVMGGNARMGETFHNVAFKSVVYSVYTNNWSPAQTVSQLYNSTHLTVAYDYNNLPVVFFGKEHITDPKYHNVSYSFWTGSSWTALDDLMTDMKTTYYAYIFPEVDFFTDNNAVFAWFNRTNDNGDYTIYYTLGNSSSVETPKTAFSGVNITGLAMKVDRLDRAVMVFGNTSTTTNKTTLYSSIYNRTIDQWSDPEIIMQEDTSLLSFSLGVPEISFNSSNHAAITILKFDFDTATLYDSFLITGRSGSWSILNTSSTYGEEMALKKISYDGLDRLVIIGKCDAGNFNLSYGNNGLCYNTYDGSTFTSLKLIEEPEFKADQVITDQTLLSNKEGSVVLALCAQNESSYYNVYVMKWDDNDFVNPEAVQYNLIEEPKPSCPFLYSWDGDDYWFEHESYGFAVFRGWEYTSYERLDYLKPVNGLLNLKLTEELPETSYTDSLILKAVEHDPSVEVMPSLDGTIHTISEWVKPSACVDYDGFDCLGLISEDEGLHWRTNFDNKDLSKDEDLRDGLIIEFDKPAGSVSPKLFLRLRESGFLRMGGEAIIENLGSNNIDYFYNLFSDAPIISGLVREWRKGVAEIQVSVWDGSSWVEAESFGVGSADWNEVLIPLNEVITDTVKVKLESSSGVYLIDEVKVDYSVDQEVRVIELEPVSMTKGEQDVLETLGQRDGNRLVLDRGDEVKAVFEAVNETPGKAYSYMTDITGYYEIYPPINEVALDLGVYMKVLRLLDPRVTARHVYNRLLNLNLNTGMGDVELITSLAMFGLVVLIAVLVVIA